MAKTQVYLIGAGPGDPELITTKACRILGMVDVVLYDYLVHPNIILMATRKKICVGKKKGAHSTNSPRLMRCLLSMPKKAKWLLDLKVAIPWFLGAVAKKWPPYQRQEFL